VGRKLKVSATAAPEVELAEEELLRGRAYGLLGRLLRAPPDRVMLASLAQLAGDETGLGRAFAELAGAARAAEPVEVADEYDVLFIGVTQGELIPFASYYLTGFLHERPLARLRGDMARLGIARVDEVHEPEDHIAALCEIMAGLIAGTFGTPASLAEQQRFYEAHLAGWAPRFFEDLEGAASARFYRPVGRVGRIFMTIEREAFAMAA
jgi:TorA maturation chaperone TorD